MHGSCLSSCWSCCRRLEFDGPMRFTPLRGAFRLSNSQDANASAPAVAALVPASAPATLSFTGTVLGLPDGAADASHLPPQLSAGPLGLAVPALPNTTYYALAAGTGLGSLQSQLSYVQVTPHPHNPRAVRTFACFQHGQTVIVQFMAST